MLQNKICITQKGIDFINNQKQQFYVQQPKYTRQTSLPVLSIRQKSTQSSLSKLTLHLQQLQVIGLKKLMINQEDKLLEKTLVNQLKGKPKYFQHVIPNLIKMTRDSNTVGNFKSRLERGKAYMQRLQNNFLSTQQSRQNLRLIKDNPE